MEKLKKNRKGFTLIELVIVIVIIGILATISVPIYRGYTRRAMAAEGRSLVGAVAKAEKVYYAEHTAFLAVANTNNNDTLGVDARMNRYFTTFTITTAAGPTFTVTSAGTGDAAGITVTLTQPANAAPAITETGI